MTQGILVLVLAGGRDFSLLLRVQTGSDVHLALSVGVKQPGHEVDHSQPSSPKLKNDWLGISDSLSPRW